MHQDQLKDARATGQFRLRSLDPTFDEAIVTMAAEIVGAYRVTDRADSTYAELRERFAHGEQPTVWSGASNFTIFGSPEVNFALRAWHDRCHVVGQHPFTLAGEAETALLQFRQLSARFPGHPNSLRWKALLLADIVGQALFVEVQSKFPVNQRLFVKSLVNLLLEPQARVPEHVPQYRR